MKNYHALLFLLLLLFLPSYAYPSTLGDIRLSLIEGDVQVWTEETSDWVPASINMPLKEGDRVWVPEGGRTELQLRDGTNVRLDQDSSLDILRTDKNDFQFYLSAGRSYTYFRGLKGAVIQLDTPISSVRAYDRAVFKIDVLDEDSTEISVLRGSVYAETRDGKTRVPANKTLYLRNDTSAELMPIGPPDDWERWNKERNKAVYERRYSSRYLPDELEGYSSDFDENGKWVNVSDYGYVWTPTVMVSVGWAPYQHGRWVWIGGDYVWIGYEPWGWAPYHYGRWSFIASIGWCWIPPVRGAVYWGPGYVGWVHTPDYISWVPLAPNEIYYGYGYYGPHSVNLHTVGVVAQAEIRKTVYRNAQVRNAVTALSSTAFLSGRRDPYALRENPFLTQKISIGRPQIRPERATSIPAIREISQAKRPPQRIRNIEIKAIKETRPLVRERKASAFRSVSTQKTLPVRILKDRSSRGQGGTVGREILQQRQTQPAERQQRSGGDAGTILRDTKKPVYKPHTEKPSLPVQPQQRQQQRSGGDAGTILRDIKKPSVEPRTERPSVPVQPQQKQQQKSGVGPGKVIQDIKKPRVEPPAERPFTVTVQPQQIEKQEQGPLQQLQQQKQESAPLPERKSFNIQTRGGEDRTGDSQINRRSSGFDRPSPSGRSAGSVPTAPIKREMQQQQKR